MSNKKKKNQGRQASFFALFFFLILDEVVGVFPFDILLSINFPCVTFIMYEDDRVISISDSTYVTHVLFRLYQLCLWWYVDLSLLLMTCWSITVYDGMLNHHCFWWHIVPLLFLMACWPIVVLDGILTHCCFGWHVDSSLFLMACWSIVVFDGMLINHCFWWHTNLSFFWWHVDTMVLSMACWCIIVFDVILTNHCSPSMNPTWSWCIYFNVFWNPFAIILLRILVSMFIKEIVYLFTYSWVHI